MLIKKDDHTLEVSKNAYEIYYKDLGYAEVKKESTKVDVLNPKKDEQKDGKPEVKNEEKTDTENKKK